MFNSEQLEKEWAPILEAADAPPFVDQHRKDVILRLLENQRTAMREEHQQAGFGTMNEAQTTGSVSNWDPVLISLTRRAMPNLIAFDVAGVQPMNAPTSLIFAMRSTYNAPDLTHDVSPFGNAGGATITDGKVTDEALFDTIDSGFAAKQTTKLGEAAIKKTMGFTIDKLSVEAETRALAAEYSLELAHDLQKVHGLSAETELANILSTEILAEINREMIDTMNLTAVKPLVDGSSISQVGTDWILTNKAGVTSTFTSEALAIADAMTNGANTVDLADPTLTANWMEQRFRYLLFKIELVANDIALKTRRGKGNFIICSANVASALAAASVMQYSPELNTRLKVDATGNTFAGTINGQIKVYIDPYATTDFVTVGYKGSNAYDAGMFYCPYVPLTMMKAQDPSTFQPKIAFKTRYGMVANPFVGDGKGTLDAGINPYYQTFEVKGLYI